MALSHKGWKASENFAFVLLRPHYSLPVPSSSPHLLCLMYSHFLTTISLSLSYGKVDNCSFLFYGLYSKIYGTATSQIVNLWESKQKKGKKFIIIFKCYWSIFRLTILYNFFRNYLILIPFTYFFPVFFLMLLYNSWAFLHESIFIIFFCMNEERKFYWIKKKSLVRSFGNFY